MITTIEEKAKKRINYEQDPNLGREVKKFLKKLNSFGAPALETLPYIKARRGLANLQAEYKEDLTGVLFSETTINSDGYTLKLNIVRPENKKGILPAFMFIHGGGWVLGDFTTHKRMVRDLVVLSGAVAVFVNYTPTPDAQFPQAINEIYAATKWVSENGKLINVDGSRLAMVGNSVGGNMTAVTTLMAKQNKGPKIKLQILMWPIVDANFETESYRLYGEDRFLTTSLMKWMYDMYIEDPSKRNDFLASPLQATFEQLQGLPPALIQVAENDVLRDEGEAYGRKLDEAGVPVTCIRYNGMIHDFGLLNGLAELPAVKSLFIHAAAELKKYLA
tara:strand:+ start:28571 stop:29569 length:999 start_codon:yes stop_codon:yes gene_type:complete